MTIFRVGTLAVLVGYGGLGCPALARPQATQVGPALVIPPLDGGAASRSRAEGGVRFGHPLPTPGSAWTVTVHASSLSEDPAGGGQQASTYESELRTEIVSVDGPAPSRVKLRFVRNVQTYQGNPVPTIIDGKEYIVDARAPHVRDATGGAAPEAEAQRVLDAFPDLGTRARIDEVLPGEDVSLRVGERHDDLAAAILRIIHPRAWTLRAGTASLARTEGDLAIFALTLEASSERGLRMVLAGEARVRIHDASLSDLSLEGRYENTAPGANEPPGTFVLQRHVTWEEALRSGR